MNFDVVSFSSEWHTGTRCLGAGPGSLRCSPRPQQLPTTTATTTTTITTASTVEVIFQFKIRTLEICRRISPHPTGLRMVTLITLTAHRIINNNNSSTNNFNNSSNNFSRWSTTFCPGKFNFPRLHS